MTLSQRRRALFLTTVAIATLIAVTEDMSLLAIRLSRPFLIEEIRTTRDILREQSERIQRLLERDSSHMLAPDPLLGWRYRAGYHDSANTMNSQDLRSTRQYTRSEEHTSELQSRLHLVCRLLLEKKKKKQKRSIHKYNE